MPQENGSSVQDVLRIDDETRAYTLLTALMEWEIDAFIHGPRSPGEVAELSGRPLRQVLRHIKRLEELKLLEVKTIQKRAGRPIKHYGLTARSFYIPSAVLPLEETLPLISGFVRQEAERHLFRNMVEFCGVQGLQVSVDGPHQGLRLARAPGEIVEFDQPGLPVMSNSWRVLELDYEDATAMNDELAAVMSKYANRKGGQPYVIHMLITPMTDG